MKTRKELFAELKQCCNYLDIKFDSRKFFKTSNLLLQLKIDELNDEIDNFEENRNENFSKCM